MIDVATRTVPAAVLRPDDEVGRRERAAGPRPDPGADAAGLARGTEDVRGRCCRTSGCCAIDERLEHAAARPVIVPDTIVVDHGRVFVSAAFRSACRHLGICLQPAHLGSRTEKGHIERHFGSVATLFSQFASGYAGPQPGPPRPPRRGPAAVVAWPSCRNCWMSGSSRSGRTGPMTGCATPSTRAGRSPRTRSTPRWSRPPAMSRSRSARTTTSSCCRRPGGRSTPTASS